MAYQHGNFLETGVRLKLGLSATFADEGVQDYFYEVEPRFATASRPTFDAEAGYMGSRVSLSLLRPLGKRVRVFVAGQINSHHGAANEDSPLFRDDLTAGLGLGLIWSFYQSDRTVNE